jgi:hypothetical protein
LDALEVLVFADIGNSSENFGQGTPAGSAENCLEDFAMLLLGTAAMLGGAALEFLDEVLGEITDNELGHG